jgi:hypothetical protein
VVHVAWQKFTNIAGPSKQQQQSKPHMETMIQIQARKGDQSGLYLNQVFYIQSTLLATYCYFSALKMETVCSPEISVF